VSPEDDLSVKCRREIEIFSAIIHPRLAGADLGFPEEPPSLLPLERRIETAASRADSPSRKRSEPHLSLAASFSVSFGFSYYFHNDHNLHYSVIPLAEFL